MGFKLPKNISLVKEPFKFFDNIELTFKGNNLNLYQKYVRLRKFAFVFAIAMIVCWITFGFDSSLLQFVHALNAYVGMLLSGQTVDWTRVVDAYNSVYGKELHYSAFVIYGLLFWFLSRHFDKNLGIKGSKNIAYSSGLMFFSVAFFEFYWIYSFAFFQNQWWIATWMMPQLRILLQNFTFLFIGIVATMYIWADGFVFDGKEIVARKWCFNWDWKAIMLVILSIFIAIVWWFYPWPINTIQVETTIGTWQSSRYFPQTLYTIDVNPIDSVNAGVWFYVPNNLVHAWNTLVKIVWALTFAYVGKLRRLQLESD